MMPMMLNVKVAEFADGSVAVTVTTVRPTGILLAVTILVLVSTAKLTPRGTLVYTMLAVPLLSVAVATGKVLVAVGVTAAFASTLT